MIQYIPKSALKQQFLDTLEVKKVDLENELGLGVQLPVFIYKPSSHNLAFELGLKTQKGE